MVYGARLESGLGSRPHEFESRILRHVRLTQTRGSLLERTRYEIVACSRNPELDRVTCALIAVSQRAIDKWAQDPSPATDLEPYLAAQLAPFANAMRGLLDGSGVPS